MTERERPGGDAGASEDEGTDTAAGDSRLGDENDSPDEEDGEDGDEAQ